MAGDTSSIRPVRPSLTATNTQEPLHRTFSILGPAVNASATARASRRRHARAASSCLSCRAGTAAAIARRHLSAATVVDFGARSTVSLSMVPVNGNGDS